MPYPEIEPTCDALIVRVGAREANDARALALARRVVKRNLRGKWSVTPLGRQSRDFEVVRSGNRKAIAVGTAWNHVHKLEADRDVIDAEPSVELAGLEPDPAFMERQLTVTERIAAKSGGGKKHKACSLPCDWSITNTGCDRAWKLKPPAGGQRYGKGVKVGHPDTGYTHHPEIWKNPTGQNRVKSGFDFIDNDPYAYDRLLGGNKGHGTKTASVIMSNIGTADVGPAYVSGTAPESSLVSYRDQTCRSLQLPQCCQGDSPGDRLGLPCDLDEPGWHLVGQGVATSHSLRHRPRRDSAGCRRQCLALGGLSREARQRCRRRCQQLP